MSEAAFRIRDYTLTSMATGLAARNVRELRERIASAPEASLFHHFWGRLLRQDGNAGEYGNDLAEWAMNFLHDPVLAERLALVDPLRLPGAEALRERVAEILDQRIEETAGHAPETPPEDAFHFVSDQMVIYDTGPDVEQPEDLPRVVPRISDASLFLHFVHPRGLSVPQEMVDEMSAPAWLRQRGPEYEALASQLESIDVFLVDHHDLRERVAEALRAHLGEGADS